jgi:uncharacterized protein (DUF302 family)
MKSFVIMMVGALVGAVLSVGLVGMAAPKLMLEERQSPLGLDETVKKISDAAVAKGWVISSVSELETSIKKHGGEDVLPVRLINMCQSSYASKILKDDHSRIASVLMPCTISVYQKTDGKVYIGNMNAGLMAKVFGGVIAEVMGGPVSADQQSFIDAVR